jgi:hypothetical protein
MALGAALVGVATPAASIVGGDPSPATPSTTPTAVPPTR